jgi:hypothetical protein
VNATTLLTGAALGAIFTAVAYAFHRHTRRMLVRGLVVAALVYVAFAVRAQPSPAWLGAELVGVGLYGAVAARGLRGSAWWLVAGWALHPIWDVAIHYVGPGRVFAPETYAAACLTWDLAVAAIVAGGILRGRLPAAAAARAPSGAGARGGSPTGAMDAARTTLS